MNAEQESQVRELLNELEEVYDELDFDMRVYCQKLSEDEDEEDEEDEEYNFVEVIRIY